MDFEELEKDIDQLNSIYIKANHKSRERYYALYNQIYENLLKMESEVIIELEADTKGLDYLRELQINDGPEFSYTVHFWKKDDKTKRYRVGVCIRGIPICKPDD